MYLWKCWREVRWSIPVVLLLILLMLLTTVPMMMESLSAHSLSDAEVVRIAAKLPFVLVGLVSFIANLWFTAFGIAAVLGRYAPSPSGAEPELLFSKPIRRRTVLLVRWGLAFGLSQAAVLLAAMLALGCCAVNNLPLLPALWRTLESIFAFMPMSLGFTGLSAVVSVPGHRSKFWNPRLGYPLAMILLLMLFQLPTVGSFVHSWLAALATSITTGGGLPWLSLTIMWIVALLYPFAALAIIERRDIV